MQKLVPVSDVRLSCMLPVYGRVFCSLPILFVYLRMRLSSCQRSVAGVPFDSVRILETTLLLHTTCMRSCQAVIGGLAVWRHYKSKTKKKQSTNAQAWQSCCELTRRHNKHKARITLKVQALHQSYLSMTGGGYHYLRLLVVRVINCANWLARG